MVDRIQVGMGGHAAPSSQHSMTGSHAGHDKHAGHSVSMFRDRFWLSLVLTIPVVAASEDEQDWVTRCIAIIKAVQD